MDARGTLWLDASEPDHEIWADFLGGVDLSYAASKREAAAALRRLEVAVAQAVGVGMVFCPVGLSMTAEYRCVWGGGVAVWSGWHGVGEGMGLEVGGC